MGGTLVQTFRLMLINSVTFLCAQNNSYITWRAVSIRSSSSDNLFILFFCQIEQVNDVVLCNSTYLCGKIPESLLRLTFEKKAATWKLKAGLGDNLFILVLSFLTSYLTFCFHIRSRFLHNPKALKIPEATSLFWSFLTKVKSYPLRIR